MQVTVLKNNHQTVFLLLLELARDGLHRTGLFSVIEGIVSPVNDDYKKLTTKVNHYQGCTFDKKSSSFL